MPKLKRFKLYLVDQDLLFFSFDLRKFKVEYPRT